jgi:hypothetical protein
VLHLEKHSIRDSDGTSVDAQAAAAVAVAPIRNGGDLSVAPNGAHCLPLHNHRRWGADAESDTTGDHPPHSIQKIEFPEFNGTDDPMAWLNRSERYFTLHGTLENQRV